MFFIPSETDFNILEIRIIQLLKVNVAEATYLIKTNKIC
jgi:hypothetical protein